METTGNTWISYSINHIRVGFRNHLSLHISEDTKRTLRGVVKIDIKWFYHNEDYFIEDVTEVIADYHTLILKIINELVDGSFAVMKEFGDKYTKQ